jgi:hypothetical protein
MTECVRRRSDGAGFSKRLVGAVFVNRLKAASRNANANKLLQLWHPNALTPQIRGENARHAFRDVPAYATLLFGQAAPVDHASARGF